MWLAFLRTRTACPATNTARATERADLANYRVVGDAMPARYTRNVDAMESGAAILARRQGRA